MNNINLFTQPLPNTPDKLPKLPRLDDTTQPLAARARAYLHSNCANCHRPGVAGVADTDLRYTTQLAQTKTCNVRPQKGDLGVNGANILIPGQPDKSTLYLRMKVRDQNRMPSIGSVVEHKQATDVIRRWIQGLRTCN